MEPFSLWQFLSPILYILLFIVAFELSESCWFFWRQTMYKNKIQWLLLEIKIPRETTRGPKAMEQIMASVFNLRNSRVGPKETWIDGEVTRWFSIEVAATKNTTRFYLRIPKPLRHPFVSAFYAHYPEIEIVDADHDYVDEFPSTYQALYKSGIEMYGMEIAQKKNPAYGIQTYKEFETKVGDEKGRILDSMAGMLEVIGKMKPDETMWLQFLITPDTKEAWIAGADKIIDKLKTSTQGGEEHGSMADTEPIRFRFRTQGEEKTLERVEEKKAKPAFEVIPRMIYMAPKHIYNRDLLNRGLFGYMAQFDNDDQRLEKVNKIRSKVDWDTFPFFFPDKRLYWKRISIFREYRDRFIPEETFIGTIYHSYIPWAWCFFHQPMIISSEEFATYFHIPTNVVLTQTTMERIESKRIPTPSNIPRQ